MVFSAPKLDVKNVLTQQEFQLTVVGLPNVYWTNMSGLKEVKESGEYYDGTTNRKRYTSGGILSVENVTLSIPFDTATFKTIAAWANKFRDGGVTNLTILPMRYLQTSDPVPLSIAFYLGNCRFVSLDAMGEVDKSSSDTAMTELEFSVEVFSIR